MVDALYTLAPEEPLVKTCRTLFALAAALVALAGCADSPVTPVAPPEAPAAVLGIDISDLLVIPGIPNLLGPRHAEKRIVASVGGFVELQGYRVDIPAGALPSDTTVTIDLPAESVLVKRVMAEFGPHGIQFNTPVTLSFPLTGILLSGPVEVARWENGGWTGLGGWLSLDGLRLYGTTPSFSTYGAKYIMVGG
jgi:hypothetical protein